MRLSSIATGAAFAAAIIVTLAQIYIVDTYLWDYPVTPIVVLLGLSPVLLQTVLLIFLFTPLLLLFAILRLKEASGAIDKSRRLDIAIWGVCGGILLLGLHSVGYTEFVLFEAARNVPSMSIHVTAPSRLSWLFCLACALWPIAIALGLQQLAFRRKA